MESAFGTTTSFTVTRMSSCDEIPLLHDKSSTNAPILVIAQTNLKPYPICAKSKTEMPPPNKANPNVDICPPNRENPLTDNDSKTPSPGGPSTSTTSNLRLCSTTSHTQLTPSGQFLTVFRIG